MPEADGLRCLGSLAYAATRTKPLLGRFLSYSLVALRMSAAIPGKSAVSSNWSILNAQTVIVQLLGLVCQNRSENSGDLSGVSPFAAFFPCLAVLADASTAYAIVSHPNLLLHRTIGFVSQQSPTRANTSQLNLNGVNSQLHGQTFCQFVQGV